MRKALIVFGVMALAQWLVPVISMNRSERILTDGISFVFRTSPVDPFDWFRGEYVTLHFEIEDTAFAMEDGSKPVNGESIFVSLGQENGYAKVEAIYSEAPTDGSPYLTCTVVSSSPDHPAIRIDLPFDRYYVQQGNGPRIEDMMRERDEWSGQPPEVLASVRVLDGRGVIEDLFIGGRSVKELLREDDRRTESVEFEETDEIEKTTETTE